MSGVATLKVRGAKRVFDEMAVDLPVAPNACSPARFLVRPPPLKRGRRMPLSSVTQATSLSPASTPHTQSRGASSSIRTAAAPSATSVPPLPNPSQCSETTPSASDPLQRFSDDELAALARHVPRRLKRVVERMATGQIRPVDKVFTLNDLREVVSSVLAERESELNEEFRRTLHERLSDQFRDFTKFNEDFVARQLRGRDFAYLS